MLRPDSALGGRKGNSEAIRNLHLLRDQQKEILAGSVNPLEIPSFSGKSIITSELVNWGRDGSPTLYSYLLSQNVAAALRMIGCWKDVPIC